MGSEPQLGLVSAVPDGGMAVFEADRRRIEAQVPVESFPIRVEGDALVVDV